MGHFNDDLERRCEAILERWQAKKQAQQRAQWAMATEQPEPSTRAKRGVNLAYAEAMRRCAWAPGTYTTEANDPRLANADYDLLEKSFPARIEGSCRHKSAWLQRVLGGQVVYGSRTDDRGGKHAALLITIKGRDFLVDRDRIWPWPGAPFQRDKDWRPW